MSSNKFPGIDVLGYRIFNSSLDKVEFTEKTLINTFAPNAYGLALKDADYREALLGSDMLICDGVGAAFGSVVLHGRNIKKIAGYDSFNYFNNYYNNKPGGGRIFLMGSSENTLKRMKERINREQPNLVVGFYSPPYKPVFSKEDNDAIVEAVNAFKPDVVYVGMTAPKQEKWGYQHKDRLNTKIIVAIGNVFDWHAGVTKRPSQFWINLRMEWLVRLFLRPEIFKRNTGNQLTFLGHLFLHVTHIKRVKTAA